jgi:hypothetical protein
VLWKKLIVEPVWLEDQKRIIKIEKDQWRVQPEKSLAFQVTGQPSKNLRRESRLWEKNG